MSDSLWPHGLQHARLPRLSLPSGAFSNSSPLNQWCHPAVSSSVVPFSSCPQSFPISGSFPVSRLFTSGGKSTGVLALASVLPMNIQVDFFQNWLVWSPCCLKDSQESSPAPQLESINSLVLSLFMVQLSHSYMTTGKTIALNRQSSIGKVMSLLFNTLSRWS